MECERTKELFSGYVDEEIDDILRSDVDNHIEKCSSCKLELARFRQVWGMLGMLPEVSPPSGFRLQSLVLQSWLLYWQLWL